MLDARVFTLCVFADENRVNVGVGSFVADNRPAWSDIGKEVEGASEGQVERDVTLADRSSEGTLEGNSVASDRV